jgi:dihydropteroate synthase type 2
MMPGTQVASSDRAPMRRVSAVSAVLGILNLTRDSFSDGGKFLELDAALAHARAMLDAGAAMVDVGAESSHPDAQDVSADEELQRLEPVIEALLAEGAKVSVDTYKPQVMRHVLELGVHGINDITAFADAESVAAVRESSCSLIVMHSASDTARARRDGSVPGERGADWTARVVEFFERRVAELERAGIARERLILDPGMGLFLSSAPGPSLSVLRNLDRVRALGLPLCVSVSRKSFIGAVLGRAVTERAAGTLAAEIWCARSGVAWIRTHAVRELCDALKMLDAIERA